MDCELYTVLYLSLCQWGGQSERPLTLSNLGNDTCADVACALGIVGMPW